MCHLLTRSVSLQTLIHWWQAHQERIWCPVSCWRTLRNVACKVSGSNQEPCSHWTTALSSEPQPPRCRDVMSLQKNTWKLLLLSLSCACTHKQCHRESKECWAPFRLDQSFRCKFLALMVPATAALDIFYLWLGLLGFKMGWVESKVQFSEHTHFTHEPCNMTATSIVPSTLL